MTETRAQETLACGISSDGRHVSIDAAVMMDVAARVTSATDLAAVTRLLTVTTVMLARVTGVTRGQGDASTHPFRASRLTHASV
jgi:hypothetical protein